MQEDTKEKDNGTEIYEETSAISEANADKTVRHHVYVSLAIGLIPIPVVDFIGMTCAQFNMMRKLAQIYNRKRKQISLKNCKKRANVSVMWVTALMTRLHYNTLMSQCRYAELLRLP